MNELGSSAGHVFISYVREDASEVDGLEHALRSAGIRVWRDTADMSPGEDWQAKIRLAITGNALVFLACFSPRSLAKSRSYQNEELTLALEELRKRPTDRPWLIPVRFGQCEIPDRDLGGGRTMGSIQIADLFGANATANMEKLVASVLRLLRISRDAPPEDYPLEQLSPRAFEQLTEAISLKVLGSGVKPFGPGPDGSREATFEGNVNWSANPGFGSGSWGGYVVIQAKQRRRPVDLKNDTAWLRSQIDAEFDAWMSEDSERESFPRYVIFVTNLRLPNIEDIGGIDSLNEHIRRRVNDDRVGDAHRSLRARGLRAWRIWHRDQINAFLTSEPGFLRTFPAMLTKGDLPSRLKELSGLVDPQDLALVLTAHARNTLRTERWINFSEAGGSARQSIENVIIDLRADGAGGQETTALGEIISRGDTVLKASLTASHEQRHLVLTGQPGNGKSTISRFITQVYRSAFLRDDAGSGTPAEIVNATDAALGRLGLAAPRNRRWPIRVDLAELADDLGPTGEKSLLQWISEKVTLRAGIPVKPVMLHRWLHHWPWILVLDGLDEVTSPEVRRRVLDEIESFIEEADHQDSDLLVVLTTRPTGYTERIAPEHFSQFDLQYLDSQAAIEYGRLVTSRRLADDLDRRDHVLARFEKQATDPAMIRLMKTPLQVLIMTIILERFGNLPPDRYQLFWRYYETVYDRETAKNTALSALLTQHRGSITQLHDAVGLALQVRSETSTDARALLPRSELRDLAEHRLVDLGHEAGKDVTTLSDKIVAAALQRLVLLVPAENDTVMFEIRSLQELMAARALSDGTDDQVRERLHVTAPSPHWRNTWVFIAGRLFSEGPDHRRDLVTEVVETTDRRRDWPGWLCPVGPELAADLLDDGLAATTPKWVRRLVDVALRSLLDGVPRDVRGLARGLTAACGIGNNLLYVRGALKTALASSPRARAVATMIVEMGTFGSPIPGMTPPGSMRSQDSANPVSRSMTVGGALGPKLAEIEAPPDTLSKVEGALGEMRTLRLHKVRNSKAHGTAPLVTAGWPLIVEALQDEEASLVIEMLCSDLDADLWPIQDLLAQAVWPELSRAPVGDRLR